MSEAPLVCLRCGFATEGPERHSSCDCWGDVGEPLDPEQVGRGLVMGGGQPIPVLNEDGGMHGMDTPIASIADRAAMRAKLAATVKAEAKEDGQADRPPPVKRAKDMTKADLIEAVRARDKWIDQLERLEDKWSGQQVIGEQDATIRALQERIDDLEATGRAGGSALAHEDLVDRIEALEDENRKLREMQTHNRG